jgi:hypothetical protein
MSADAKPVSASRLVMAQEMTPQDANPAEDRRRNEEARQRAIARRQRKKK